MSSRLSRGGTERPSTKPSRVWCCRAWSRRVKAALSRPASSRHVASSPALSGHVGAPGSRQVWSGLVKSRPVAAVLPRRASSRHVASRPVLPGRVVPCSAGACQGSHVSPRHVLLCPVPSGPVPSRRGAAAMSRLVWSRHLSSARVASCQVRAVASCCVQLGQAGSRHVRARRGMAAASGLVPLCHVVSGPVTFGRGSHAEPGLVRSGQVWSCRGWSGLGSPNHALASPAWVRSTPWSFSTWRSRW